MSKWAKMPPFRSRQGKRGGRFGPPGAANLVRFARSLWPKPEQEAELCEASIEAVFTIIREAKDDDLRHRNLRTILDRAYEALKQTDGKV